MRVKTERCDPSSCGHPHALLFLLACSALTVIWPSNNKPQKCGQEMWPRGPNEVEGGTDLYENI